MFAKSPPNLSHNECSAVPLVALTADLMLSSCKVAKCEKILILGGSGGVGSFAIQLAKTRGYHVTTTASPKKDTIVDGSWV